VSYAQPGKQNFLLSVSSAARTPMAKCGLDGMKFIIYLMVPMILPAVMHHFPED
jgi:hypothetical protein